MAKPCFERVPGHNRHHACHLKAHHAGPHCANVCGAGRRGGRKARWTAADGSDLVIEGPTGPECNVCALGGVRTTIT